MLENCLKVKSILYVEDDKKVQKALVDVLQDYCETLYTADDGMQGLIAFEKHRPQIVLSDIQMPIKNGIDMGKEIKKINPDVAILFTTAFSDYDYLQEAIELQVEGYILKPISLDKLESKLKTIIQNIKMKEELEQKNQMLIQQSKLASIGEMINNIAHQWRQPLATMAAMAIDMKLNIELEKEISNEKIYHCTDVIESQTSYLSHTIDDFRSFFIPGKTDAPFDVEEFVDFCVGLVRASFNHNSVQLIADVQQKFKAVCDKNQLIQAVVNILNNARDALKEAEKLQEKIVFFMSVAYDEKKQGVIVIKDNAGGIPEDIIDRIFEPYFTTKHQSNGTGLGLYITHSIITKGLRGSIVVKNDVFDYEGKTYMGAEFTIKVPLDIVEN